MLASSAARSLAAGPALRRSCQRSTSSRSRRARPTTRRARAYPSRVSNPSITADKCDALDSRVETHAPTARALVRAVETVRRRSLRSLRLWGCLLLRDDENVDRTREIVESHFDARGRYSETTRALSTRTAHVLGIPSRSQTMHRAPPVRRSSFSQITSDGRESACAGQHAANERPLEGISRRSSTRCSKRDSSLDEQSLDGACAASSSTSRDCARSTASSDASSSSSSRPRRRPSPTKRSSTPSERASLAVSSRQSSTSRAAVQPQRPAHCDTPSSVRRYAGHSSTTFPPSTRCQSSRFATAQTHTNARRPTAAALVPSARCASVVATSASGYAASSSCTCPRPLASARLRVVGCLPRRARRL